MKKIVLLLFFCNPFINSNGQQNDSQAAVYNVVIGSVIGGIGSIINKKKDENALERFAKGSVQGALGGYVVFESKRILRSYSKTNSVGYIWPSKILNSAGNSMIQNAAANRNFWEKWSINIGFNHIEYDYKKEKKISYRIMPIALIGTVDGFINGNIDINRTLTHGQFIFKSKSNINNNYKASTLINAVSYSPMQENELNNILTHEIIHVYQYEGTFIFKSLLNKKEIYWSETSKLYRKYEGIFYFDYNYLVHASTVGVQNLFGIPLHNQIQEREASYYEFKN